MRVVVEAENSASLWLVELAARVLLVRPLSDALSVRGGSMSAIRTESAGEDVGGSLPDGGVDIWAGTSDAAVNG
jgi:hypothetical protein